MQKGSEKKCAKASWVLRKKRPTFSEKEAESAFWPKRGHPKKRSAYFSDRYEVGSKVYSFGTGKKRPPRLYLHDVFSQERHMYSLGNFEVHASRL